MTTPMIPRGGLVLLRVHAEAERQTRHGLILPDIGTGGGTIFRKATIIKVGEGVRLDCGDFAGTDDLETGQVVIFKWGQRHHRGHDTVTEVMGSLFTDENGDEMMLTNEANIVLITGDVDAGHPNHDPIHLGS